jgi:AcrR family transcriptional regulator
MSRWAPDARERLESAALELFAENGYEATTVAEIADRAGLNRATFFRHFTDKREALFGGEEKLATLFAAGIRDAAPDASLAECLQAAFEAVDVIMTPEQRTKSLIRVRLVAGIPEVQERGLLKHARIAEAMSNALRDRGLDDLTARLGAEVAMLAFSIATQRWLAAPKHKRFSAHASTALVDLQARTVQLDPRIPSTV